MKRQNFLPLFFNFLPFFCILAIFRPFLSDNSKKIPTFALGYRELSKKKMKGREKNLRKGFLHGNGISKEI